MRDWLRLWPALALACGLPLDKDGHTRIPSSSQQCKRGKLSGAPLPEALFVLSVLTCAGYLGHPYKNPGFSNEIDPQTNTIVRRKVPPASLHSLMGSQSRTLGTNLFCPYYPIKSSGRKFGNTLN
jgi:hypothetical protein